MAQFPSREAEVGALAGTTINGLAEQAEHFAAHPVSVETLQESLHTYNRAGDGAPGAQLKYMISVLSCSHDPILR